MTQGLEELRLRLVQRHAHHVTAIWHHPSSSSRNPGRPVLHDNYTTCKVVQFV
jgi:hypothetical protein